MTKTVDLLGIGNAIVDILCVAENRDLQVMGLNKGMMTLIDDQTVSELEKSATVDTMQSGGSVANTMAHYAGLGGRGQFIGKIARDAVGDRFKQDMSELRIRFQTAPIISTESTGCCYVFITPDAQRTMCTHLGASTMLSNDDVDDDAVKAASFVFIEGYLWDSPGALDLIHATVESASKVGTQVALTLSDPMLVERHHDRIRRFLEEYVDIVFANELEAQQLCETPDWEESLRCLSEKIDHVVLTRGDQGSAVAMDGRTYHRRANEATAVKDTTGAGDAYAAGYLYGLTRNWPIGRCMDVASDIAAQTVAHMGGRLGNSK